MANHMRFWKLCGHLLFGNHMGSNAKISRVLSLQALESRQLFDASSQVLVDLAYHAEVSESALTDQGIFFVRDDARYGAELWATNAAGTAPHLVVDLTPGTVGSSLKSITAVEGGVYFINSKSGGQNELWWSDGTATNTRMVADNVVALERDYTESAETTPFPSDGSHVYFMRRTSYASGSFLDTGLWAASDQGKVAERLTSNDSFVEAVPGDWELRQVMSFQETQAGLSVFVVSATGVTGDREDRLFYGVTDGTPEGTKLSDFAVTPSANLRAAIALPDDKVMFSEFSSNGQSRVLAIDVQGTVELLTENERVQPIVFAKSGSYVFFSSPTEAGHALFQTDGTRDGTRAVPSAGILYDGPVALSDGSVLTTTENLEFQVTHPETLATTKLDFIVPGVRLNRSSAIYGSIVVGINKFFYIEANGSNARRLMMADTHSRTLTTVLEGSPNGAIGAQVLRGNNLFLTHVTPTHTDLIQFDIASKTSNVLANVTTDGWQGLSIDTVGEESLVGFMQGIDNASIFKLRFADARLDIVSLVDEVLSTADLYSDAVRNHQYGPFWKLDAGTIAFATQLEINGQSALAQQFSYDTSAKGLTRLVSPSLPQPSKLQSGAIYALYTDQSIYRAGAKMVYHSGHQVGRADGSIWHEIWTTGDGQSAQKLMEVRNTVSGDGNLIPLGVMQDRLYFLSTGPTTKLYRTKMDATEVEFIMDTPWGSNFLFSNFELLYHPSLPEDPQRILFRRMDDATEPGAWAITGNPPTLTKIVEQSVIAGHCVEPSGQSYTCSPQSSAGAMFLRGTDEHAPLVEVKNMGDSANPMVLFFGEDSSLTISEQKTVRLYRVDGAWLGVVRGLDDNYSFWSRMDDSTGATRVSDIDIEPFKIENQQMALLDFAMKSDAVVFIAGSKVIRLDRDGTHSFVDVPPLDKPQQYIGAAVRLNLRFYVGQQGLQGDVLLRVGDSLTTDHVYALSADARSVREIKVAGDKHAAYFAQIHDDSSLYVLTAVWPGLLPTKITRELQDLESVELAISNQEFTVSLAADRVIAKAGTETLYDGASSALFGLSIRQTTPEAIVTVNVGSVTQSSKFPLSGISISLAEQSVLRLVGTVQSPVVYQLDDDVLTITVGDLTIRVLNPKNITIEDRLFARDRNWNFSTGNDDVEIRPIGSNETELIERIRNVVIRIAAVESSEGESSGTENSRWQINTKTGSDKLTVDPNLSAIALLSIVSDLDNESRLKVNLPPVTGPLSMTRQNGRTFASVSIGGLQLQLDSSRRPEHNLVKATDADNDGAVKALDALKIINTISRRKRSAGSNADVMFGDTSGDGRVTALDAILVINHLARQSRLGQFAAEQDGSRKRAGLAQHTNVSQMESRLF